MSTEDFDQPGRTEAGGPSEDARYFSVHARYGSEVITVLEPNGEVRWETSTIYRLLGHRPEDVEGTDYDPGHSKWTRFVHPEDTDKLLAAIAGCLSTPGESPPVEYRIRHAEGSWRWFESRGVNLADDPEVGGVVVSTRDITDRKQAEEAQRESERQLLSAFEDAPMGVAVLNLEDEILAANPALCEMFGYSRDELVGKSSFEITHPDDRAESEARSQRLLSGELRKEGLEKRYLLKSGDSLWAYCDAMLVLGEQGEPEHFVCHIQDISSRKHAEGWLRLMESVTINANDAVIISEALPLDEPGPEIVYINETFTRMTGYEPEEVVGKTPRILQGPKTDRAELDRIRAALEIWQPVRAEVLNYRKDGSMFWVDLTISPVANGGGHITHWVSVQRETTERKMLEERLEHQALHDQLTGLPGRELLTDRLRQALASAERDGETAAVLFVDVDNLKLVNDSLGHEAGDQLLRIVGERLRHCLRDEDTAARISGDEFVVLPVSSGTEEDALLVAGRIMQELEAPLCVDGYEVPITVSVGIAVGDPCGESAEDLLRHADAAMYRAKTAGGGGYSVYDPDMDQADLERLQLSSDLRRAIERGELRSYYQHKVDLSTGKVAGWEALLRWEHPERGTIGPETFIPLAEETGLIVPIGKWVLEEACEQARIWRERHPKEPGQFMSVNLSPRQFADPGLEEEIERILRQTGLPAGALDLEITERVLLEDEVSDFARIRELKELGLSFSLDDFGTGYSSLLSLKQLPVDFIKIDRLFVERVPGAPEDEAFVTAMVGLAHALGLNVVAEGIESEVQWQRLRELGCDCGQGYYFSPPLPSGEASRSMERLEDSGSSGSS